MSSNSHFETLAPLSGIMGPPSPTFGILDASLRIFTTKLRERLKFSAKRSDNTSANRVTAWSLDTNMTKSAGSSRINTCVNFCIAESVHHGNPITTKSGTSQMLEMGLMNVSCKWEMWLVMRFYVNG